MREERERGSGEEAAGRHGRIQREPAEETKGDSRQQPFNKKNAAMNSDFHKPSPNGCKFRIMITNISIFPFPPQIFADKSSAPPHIAPATPRRKPLWRGESRKGRERKDARTKREMARKGKAEERRERERRDERAKDGRSAVDESGGALLRKENGLSSMKRRDVMGICLHGAHFPQNVFHVTC